MPPASPCRIGLRADPGSRSPAKAVRRSRRARGHRSLSSSPACPEPSCGRGSRSCRFWGRNCRCRRTRVPRRCRSAPIRRHWCDCVWQPWAHSRPYRFRWRRSPCRWRVRRKPRQSVDGSCWCRRRPTPRSPLRRCPPRTFRCRRTAHRRIRGWRRTHSYRRPAHRETGSSARLRSPLARPRRQSRAYSRLSPARSRSKGHGTDGSCLETGQWLNARPSGRPV